jgi:HlyD family secretion protein
MAHRLRAWPRASVWLRAASVITLIASAWAAIGAYPRRNSPRSLDAIEWSVVRRVDLDTDLLVGGDLQPLKETKVACQVEDITDSDGVVIISMVEDGTPVKKGDTLCLLDSSQLEELARQEEIMAIETRSACEQTRLALEVARIALREYEDGLVFKITREFEGRIALARSDSHRQADRLSWAEGMFAKGYESKAQLIAERQALDKARHDLRKFEGEFRLFRDFQAPKEMLNLRSQIKTAELNHAVATERLKAQEDRLASTRKQVENCRVRAPHDGIAVHANKRAWWKTPLNPGVRVQQDQELFKIPDLGRMEVEVSVHETMGPRVQVGMRARVRIASIADRVITGRVASIVPFPIVNEKEWDERLRHYIARVRLDDTPSGALPLMSAVVEIDTGQVPGALVIPVEAMSVVEGRQCCYVRVPDGVALRTISTRRATTDLLEVTRGLSEGEQVVSRFARGAGLRAKVDDRFPVKLIHTVRGVDYVLEGRG